MCGSKDFNFSESFNSMPTFLFLSKGLRFLFYALQQGSRMNRFEQPHSRMNIFKYYLCFHEFCFFSWSAGGCEVQVWKVLPGEEQQSCCSKS